LGWALKAVREASNLGNLLIPNEKITFGHLCYGYLFFEDIHKTAALTNAFGPIEIEALNSIRVMATERIASSERTSAYFEGVDTDAAGRTVVLPYSVENTEFRTNLGINNLGATTANVTVRLLDKNGLSLGNLAAPVPPGGLTQLNSINTTLVAGASPANREGYLRLEADQNIVGWTSQIDNLTQDPSLVVGKGVPQVKLLIPSTTNAGSFKSTLVVANLDAAPANVEFKFRDAEGNVKASTIDVISGNGFLSSTDILVKLGMVGEYGPLEIVSLSGKPILAVSRVYSLQRTGGYFEGVP
jgi:hypothetical protein